LTFELFITKRWANPVLEGGKGRVRWFQRFYPAHPAVRWRASGKADKGREKSWTECGKLTLKDLLIKP